MPVDAKQEHRRWFWALPSTPPLDKDEVRASVRFPIQLPVTISVEGSPSFQGETENISSSGILLRTDREIARNAQISFAISMPAHTLGTPTDVVVKGVGRVVRCFEHHSRTSVGAVIDEYSFAPSFDAHGYLHTN
jgi:hypothetical protein